MTQRLMSRDQRRRSAAESVERVTREQALEEELFLGLRQLGGIDLPRIQREYSVNLEEKAGAAGFRGND